MKGRLFGAMGERVYNRTVLAIVAANVVHCYVVSLKKNNNNINVKDLHSTIPVNISTILIIAKSVIIKPFPDPKSFDKFWTKQSLKINKIWKKLMNILD